MYELFLTAFIEERDVPAACSVLGGLCGMPPWQTTSRVLYYQGPPRPTGISNLAAIDKPMRRDTGLLWKELHQNLSRQSFVLQARYEVAREREAPTAGGGEGGEGAAGVGLDAETGTLRWTDFPDPPHGRPLITQRKVVELWDQKNLPLVMGDNSYQYKTETVEESQHFFRDDIEFSLTRHFLSQPITSYTPLTPSSPTPSPSPLPPSAALTPIDAQGRRILHVRTHVLQDNKPDEIRKAQDRLMAARAELGGVFEFRAVDRKVFDTRVALQAQGIQALPQKVTLGKM